MDDESKSKSRHAFNASNREKAASQCPATAALMIGVQTFDGMTPSDAQAYADHLGQTLKALRQNNIPVIWAAIDSQKGNKPLIPLSGAASATRDMDELRNIGFEGFDAGQSNHDIFRDFIRRHGPKSNEPVFRKSFMSALTEATDIEHRAREDHQKALLLEAGVTCKGDTTHDSPLFREIESDQADTEFFNFFKNEPTVADYLRQQNISHTLIMGQIAHYCVLETAISAAVKKYDPTIIGDRCLSNVYTFDQNGHEQGTCVWQSDKDNIGRPLNQKPEHETKIQNRMHDIINGEAETRGLSKEAIAAIGNIKIMDFSDVIKNIAVNNQALALKRAISPGIAVKL